MGCARCDDLPVRGVLCESIESRLQKRGVGLRGWSSVEGSSLLAAGVLIYVSESILVYCLFVLDV